MLYALNIITFTLDIDKIKIAIRNAITKKCVHWVGSLKNNNNSLFNNASRVGASEDLFSNENKVLTLLFFLFENVFDKSKKTSQDL